MRILHFCNYADRVGGAEVYAQSLVSALRARGHEVALFGGSPGAEIDRPGLRVIQRPPYDPSRLLRDPPALAALREYIQRFQPEVLHAHNVFSVAIEVVEFLCAQDIPLLQTVHDFQLLCPNSWCVRGDGSPCPGGAGEQCFQHGCQSNYPYRAWDVLLASLRHQILSRGTNTAVAPSSHLVDRLRAHGWRDVRHLPYFIDFEPGAPDVVRDPGEILYVGRLQREKGVDVLLAAMPAVLRARPEARLAILGGGTESQALREMARQLGLSRHVRFLDSVSRQDLGEFYSRASLCVLPSIWTENSPLVAYECLLSGLPMVGSRIGGIPELIEPDCGFTFHPRDAGDLAAQIVRYLSQPATERQRMSEAARARARRFDKSAHLERMEQLYGELAACRRKPDGGASAPRLWPILEEVEREMTATRGSRSLLQRARHLARRLGLPKVIRTR